MTPIMPTGIPSPSSALTTSGNHQGAKVDDATSSFKNLLLESLEHVNSMQHDADHAVEQLMTGGEVDPAEVLTSIQKADMTFRMMLQIRNKLVQAYQEVNQIRI